MTKEQLSLEPLRDAIAVLELKASTLLESAQRDVAKHLAAYRDCVQLEDLRYYSRYVDDFNNRKVRVSTFHPYRSATNIPNSDGNFTCIDLLHPYGAGIIGFQYGWEPSAVDKMHRFEDILEKAIWREIGDRREAQLLYNKAYTLWEASSIMGSTEHKEPIRIPDIPSIRWYPDDFTFLKVQSP